MVEIKSEQSKKSRQVKLFAYLLATIIVTGMMFAVALSNTMNWWLLVPSVLLVMVLLVVSNTLKTQFALLGHTPLILKQKDIVLGQDVDAQVIINQPNFKKFTQVEVKLLSPGMEGPMNIVWRDHFVIDIACIQQTTFLNFTFSIPRQLTLHPGSRFVLVLSYVENMQEIKREYVLTARDPNVRMV